jgi:hypothetical protein
MVYFYLDLDLLSLLRLTDVTQARSPATTPRIRHSPYNRIGLTDLIFQILMEKKASRKQIAMLV